MIAEPVTVRGIIHLVSMIEFFEAIRDVPLIRYSLLAGIVSSFTFGVVGSFVVARRIGYIAAAIGHSILGGIGASFYFSRTKGWEWFTPTIGAVVAALLSAAVIGWVTLKAKDREDTIIGAIWAFGMALGLIFIHYTPGKAVILESYIFGNILLTSEKDVLATLGLSLLVLAIVGLFYHKLVSVCFDEEFARLRGVSSNGYYFLLLAITAVSMVLLVKLAGIILSIALIVLPAATASKFSRRLWVVILIAIGLSVVYNVSGLALSFQMELPTGPFIVVISSVVYAIALFKPGR